MDDTRKTREQLINELTELRNQIAAFRLVESAQMEFSENLIQNSAVPTFVLDNQHRVIIWNRACEELTGLIRADVVGTDEQWKAFYNHKRPVLADIVLTGSNDDLEKSYALHMKSPLIPEGQQAEGWYPDLNGRERYIFFDAVPIRNAAGQIIAVIETLQDITDRKRKEESLRTLSQAIEQSPVAVVITDRKGAIEYVNPRFSQITGYSAGEAIGKNPRILKSDWHPAEFYQELWATILAGGEWHGEFRNTKKNGELHWISAAISPVKNSSNEITHFVGVQEDVTEKKWAAEVEQAGVQLRLEVPPVIVRADRDGLAVVLRNLLENALKFSRNSRPQKVEIGACAEGGVVILWVRDNGIGFDMKFHDRIFEIFQRLQHAEDYPGTGIGLALVRKAIGRMGGRVWAESVPGGGATFFLEIPL